MKPDLFWVVLACIGVFFIIQYLSRLAKSVERQAMWLAVDAMAHCRKEFAEYAEACEELSG